MESRYRYTRTYNERIFSGGFRSYFHFARFLWTRDEIARLSLRADTVVELGCYDGRLLDYLPSTPSRYVGMDANVENGLDMAKRRYGAVEDFTFLLVTSADQIPPLGHFDLGASSETLEHVPPHLVDGYLDFFAQNVDHLIVTVPNETGPIFLAKWIVKAIFNMSPKDYTFAELFYATIGRTDKVRRREHKGFNYRDLVKQNLQADGYRQCARLPVAMAANVALLRRWYLC